MMNTKKNKAIIFILITFIVTVLSCQFEKEEKLESQTIYAENEDVLQENILAYTDTIIISKEHDPNIIFCDLDGDELSDTVIIVQNVINEKYGLKITFGNNKVEYLGMGEDVLERGFDDLNWVGVFEVVPKGDTCWNNVSELGEIMDYEEIKEEDKIILPNDGIFIHASESCGGGVIYLNNGKFEWIQQE